MKWEPITLPTQRSTDVRYCIVRAMENIWHAYYMPKGMPVGDQIGIANSDDMARQLCEDDEPLRKRP